MSDPQVDKWKQTGTVYCWRYRDNARNYPGWNIAADKEGCAELLSLIDLMEAAPYSSSKTIRLTPPTDDVLSVPNNRLGEARWTAARSLSLRYPKGKVEPDHWDLEREGDTLTLSIGEAKLRELRSGVEDMMAGEGDWGIGESDEEILFFWWVRP